MIAGVFLCVWNEPRTRPERHTIESINTSSSDFRKYTLKHRVLLLSQV